MLFPLWRKLWGRGPGRPRGPRRPGGQHASCRPRLEALEDRMLPATGPVLAPALPTGAGAILAPHQAGAAPAGAVSGLHPLTAPGQMKVTVVENSPATVINLSSIFAAVSGIRHQDGLEMSLMGNTNPGLVRTELSKAELTLQYARGRSGTATIVVAATDADGVCVKEKIFVTVLPLLHRPVTGAPSPPPAAANGAMMLRA